MTKRVLLLALLLFPATAQAQYHKEDAAHVSGHTGTPLWCVRKDSAVALAGTDGDYIPCIVDGTGRLWISAVQSGAWTVAATQSGTWTVTGAGGTFPVTGTFWQALQPISIDQTGNNNAVDVLTMPTVTVTDGAGALNVIVDSGALTATVTDGAGALNVIVDSGSITANAGTNLNTSALLTTSAHDAALGTAGTADAQVRTVQGIASMTPLQVADASGPLTVDGTVAATQSGTWTVQPGNTANTTPWLASLNEGSVTADILDLTNNNPLTVAILDGAGSQITSFGGGTQYTEADTDASITGTAMLWEDTSDTLRAVSAAKPLPVNIISGAGSGGTAAADDSAFTLGTTNVTVAGCIEATDSMDAGDLGGVKCGADRELDVDVMNTVTVSGTVTANAGSGTFTVGDGSGALNVIVDSSALPSGAATSANQSTVIGHVDGLEGLLTTIDADTGILAGDTTTTGTLDSLNDTIVVALAGKASAGFHIDAGTLAGTVSFGFSMDGGTTWTATSAVDVSAGARVGTVVYTNPNSADDLSVIVVGGATHARVLLNPFTSGTAAARMVATNTIDPFVLSLAAQPTGSPASGISMAVGGTDGTNHRNVAALNAAPTTEYGLVTRNIPSGTQTVSGTVTANAGTGTFTVGDGSGALNVIVDSITAGDTDIGNVDMEFAGTAAATDNGASSAQTQRVTIANNSTGILAGVTTVTTLTNLTNLPNEGQQTAANSISVTPDTDNDAVGAAGAAPPGEYVAVGGVTSGATGGFLAGVTVCDSFANVTVSSATTTLLVTGVSGRHVRICAISLITALANNVALISGTGATCGTGTTGMTGGTTSGTGYNFAANGGLAQGSGSGEINRTNATGDSVCVITSAATQLSGRISYAIY